MNESRGIDETQVKDRLRREYIKRVRKVLKSELNSKNRMLAIGEIAVPVLQYSFGVVNWKIKELENIDRQTRKMLTTYKMHHPKADVDRLYTSRKDGGRGLMQQEHLMDKEQTYEWLHKGELKGETESLIIVAQDQAINTRYHKKNILRQNVNSKCRLREEYEETTEHIKAGCTILAKHEYIKRHDQVCRNLHYNICKEYGIKVGKKWYEHNPQPVIEAGETIIMWNKQIQTDREIRANKPDIVIKQKKENKCLIIDVAVPGDRRMKEKEAERVLKYKELALETQRMWNCRTKVIPVVIGALGTTTNSFKNYIKEIPGHQLSKSLQKSVLLGTAHI
ncbi:hypothetical protein ILUMI_16115 [Ignelater luminosus]|uniref:Reverse transcriptase n=1 Tax=Ignelater luminosus TaxID=2038154 RepID=A0A8K0CSV6_IGNLU|nr:hypothetical protein ILUMI_16115 [Ignelater luminosus]